MQLAWRDFVMWAFEQPEIRADFEAATGTPALPGKPSSVLDLMIDDATGVNESYAGKFLEWATDNLWDSDEGDES
jgi:hypothetical protein